MKRSRKEQAIRVVTIMLVWIQQQLNSRHLRSYPQVAIYSFEHIGIRINAFGRYENDELAALMEFLQARDLIAGDCLDVGANIGNHALAFSGMFDCVHAFEPARRPFQLLSINAGIRGNVLPRKLALSDAPGRATLTSVGENLGEGSLAVVEAAPGHGFEREDVDVATIDGYVEENRLPVGLVKIDVEGHELAVLLGARVLLRTQKPVVVFEQQEAQFAAGTSDVIEFLRGVGYNTFYVIRRTPNLRWRWLTTFARLLVGERVELIRTDHFEEAFHPMIVAINR